jgi:hypothetical protein
MTTEMFMKTSRTLRRAIDASRPFISLPGPSPGWHGLKSTEEARTPESVLARLAELPNRRWARRGVRFEAGSCSYELHTRTCQNWYLTEAWTLRAAG